MKFLADECCDAELVSSLRSEGYDVVHVMESQPGASDKKVPEKAFAENRILLTEDKDFGELVYCLKKPAYGIVLLRFEVRKRHLKWPRLKQLIDKYGFRLEGFFIAIDPEKFRFRPLSGFDPV